MCADLDIPNYTMLYTSKILKKKTFVDNEEGNKRLLLDQIINDIGRQHEETEIGFWDLMMVSVNKHYDMMLGFQGVDSATKLSEAGNIAVNTSLLGEVVIPTGPLVPQGTINYKRYQVRAKLTPGIPQACIVNELSKRYRLREVEVPTYTRNGKQVPIQFGNIECYIEFNSCEEALNVPNQIEVEGILVDLYHKGRYKC